MVKFLVLLTFILCRENIYSQDLLIWKSSLRLQWSDFLGTPLPDNGQGAISNTGIIFNVSVHGDKLSYDVTAVFYRKKSWVKSRSQWGLEHEQGHFNITEIFSRRLRQAAATYKLNNLTDKSDLGKLYDKIENERNAMQDLYDKETDFSRNREMQKFWNQRIRRELRDLKE